MQPCWAEKTSFKNTQILPSFPKERGGEPCTKYCSGLWAISADFSTYSTESTGHNIYFLASTCLWMRATLSRALFSSSSTAFGSSTVRFSLKASRTRRRAYVLQKREIKTTHSMICICLLLQESLPQLWKSNWPKKKKKQQKVRSFTGKCQSLKFFSFFFDSAIVENNGKKWFCI